MEKSKKIFLGLIAYGIFLLILMSFSSYVLTLDKNIFFLINNISNPFLDLFFVSITYIGSTVFWILLIILFWMKKEREISIRLIFALIIDSFLLTFLKWFFVRPRPSERFANIEVLSSDIGPSFPSGHSERVFSGAVILGYVYKKLRYLLFLLAFLVSFSRIYIGVHYPIDSLIGSINGIMVGYITLLLPTKRIQNKLEKYWKLLK